MWTPKWVDETLHNVTETGILYKGNGYDLVDPFRIPSFCEELGIREMEGIRSVFSVRDDHLFLETLQIRLPDGESYPYICGVKAVAGYNILEDFSMFWGMEDGKVYKNIDFPANLTGTILMGRETDENAVMTPDFRVSNFYDWYRELLLLSFHSGRLVEQRDVSGMTEQYFQEICRFANELKKD